MTDPVVGHRLFSDGVTRPVYLEAATDRQYVIDLDGEQVYGQWLRPEEEADVPAIVVSHSE